MQWLRKLFPAPTPDGFAKIVEAELRRQGASELRLLPDLFQLEYVDHGGSHCRFNLHNAFPAYGAAWPGRRRRVLQRFLSGARDVAMPRSWEEAERSLRPAVRDRLQFEDERLQQKLQDQSTAETAFRQLTPRLARCLVLDQATSMLLVTSELLERWAVDFEAAWERASRNLEEVSEPRWRKTRSGLYLSAWSDDYDASRLLVERAFLGLEVQGDLVAIVPNRNLLIVTGTDDLSALEQAFELAEQALAELNPISALPLRQVGGQWISWELRPAHPCYAKYQNIRLREYSDLYRQQKVLLDQLHPGEDDVYISKFMVDLGDGEELPRSLSVWTKGCRALLARADDIAFVDPEDSESEDIRRFPWARVEAVCGERMKATEHYPPRTYVDDFPSNEEFLRMQGEG